MENTGTHLLISIIDASWKVNAHYNAVCMRRGGGGGGGGLSRMRDPLPLPFDSKYHMFCFLIIKKSSFRNQRPL